MKSAPPPRGARHGTNEALEPASPGYMKAAPGPGGYAQAPGPAQPGYAQAPGPGGYAQAPGPGGYAQAPPQGAAMQPRQPQVPQKPQPPPRPQKAANLDTSPVKVQSLVEASRRGRTKEDEKLLTECVDPDGKGADGTTPLMAAAQFGSVPSVEALLAGGGDPNIGKDGTNQMTVAFQQGHKEILNILFKSTFQNLDSMVARPPAASPAGGMEMNGYYAEPAGGDEVPASAIMDLREVTKNLSEIGKPRPSTAAVVAQSPTAQEAPPEEKDQEQGKAREDAVKDAMKLIARTK